jgi:hypothetical protein
MTLRETDSDVLKHLCTCPDCRKALYEYRQTVCKEVEGEPEQEKFPCEKVSAADIFDYVVPYGLDPAKNQYARFRESLCSHVRRCPACIGRMQQLHNTVYAILDRADSEVATVYKIEDSAKGRAASESNDLYSSFPIKVEVLNWKDEAKAKKSASTIDSTVTLKYRVSSVNLKSLAKVSFAAAAVILIALALFLYIPTARAVSIEQIYKAIEKVRNVYIASFVPGQQEPVQEQWISRTLNINKIKTKREIVLWDLPNKVRKIKNLDTNLTEITSLANDQTIKIEKTIAGSLDILPFPELSLVPENGKWCCVTQNSLEPSAKGLEVYDLTWNERTYDGSLVFKKWRVFADIETNLPQRIEWYRKLYAGDEYSLVLVNVIDYIKHSEIQDMVKEEGF